MDAFTKLPGVLRVLGKGEYKSSIEFNDGVRSQVWVHAPEKFGRRFNTRPGPRITTCSCGSSPWTRASHLSRPLKSKGAEML
jgi:hypothetical protein